jgi:hypothetical protein
MGLNTDMSAQVLGPEWATLANNCIFDDNNRLAVRKGWEDITTTPGAGTIMRVFEYATATGTSEIISSTDANIYSGTTTLTSKTGTLSITEGNIKFVNFNDKVLALGVGTSPAGIPAVYSGSGNFADVTVASGTGPNGTIGTAAFGRLWVCDADGKTIRYSALLDETKWDSVDGGGSINMGRAWVAGQDTVIAIAEFAGDLVIFGRNQIIVWTDGAGGDVGLNPLNMYISDTITGLGAITQFGLTQVEGDLWFMSPNGIHSLMRARGDRTTPTDAVTANVEAEYEGFLLAQGDENDCTLTYTPEEGYVICNFPDPGRSIIVHGRAVRTEGGPVYRTTTWTSNLQCCTYIVGDRTTLGSLSTDAGEIFQHKDYDDNGSSYSFAYESGWLDLGEQASNFYKWVKKLTSIVLVGSSTTVTYTLFYDFDTNPRTFQATAIGTTGAEFNVSEFTNSGAGIGYKDPTVGASSGETEFSGGITLRTMPIPASGGGQYVKVGVSVDNNSGQFALQQINLFARIGRIANV